MKDQWNRKINYMRISVIDQCNLRCCYCMPKEDLPCLEKSELLTLEEIEKIVSAGVGLGIDTIKITGGEPLLRKNICELIANIKGMVGIKQVTLTTNGVLLQKYAVDLKAAGIDSININLPALTREKYKAITRRDEFVQVIEGIREARDLGIRLKLNCVSRKTITDAELYEYGMIAMQYPIDIRFIEMMPIGYGKMFETYENDKILERLNDIFENQFSLSNAKGNGPAVYYEAPGFQGKIGFISAVSHKFCDLCNRIRLSADGELKLCLNYEKGVSLKHAIRYGNPELLAAVLGDAIYGKPQKHCFYEKENSKIELKNMVQIGG